MSHARLVAVLVRSTMPLALVLALAGDLRGQSLNWEGQTGGLVTPFADVPPSPAGSIGHPSVGFHMLNAGEVIGTHMQMSVTVGLLKRIEAGFTRSAVSSASAPSPYSVVFDRGFSNVHAKMHLVPENAKAAGWPGISAGFIFRWQRRNIIEGTEAAANRNGDLYVAATRVFAATPTVSVVANGGVKASNATLMGIGGNAAGWKARGFAAGGVVLGKRLFVGAEVLQQSDDIDGIPGASLPATVTCFGRIIAPTRIPFTIDVALVRAAGVVGPGVDLGATNRVAIGASVRF